MTHTITKTKTKTKYNMSHSNDSILCCHAEIQRLKLKIKALTEENDELKKGVTLSLRKSRVTQLKDLLDARAEILNLKRENDKLCKQVAHLECKNNRLMAGLIEAMDDKARLDWLLSKAYFIQLKEGDMLTSRQAIDEAIEEEMREKEAGNHI